MKLEAHLKGKILFVFSDPGGAKPLLSVATSLADKPERYYIVSNRQYSFYKEFGLLVNEPRLSPTEDISCFQPDIVLTGTSYTTKLELSYIKAAKDSGIPVYSYVDHWTNIRERFQDNGGEILPDRICLIDDHAKRIAIEQGIEEDKILVTGNPFQDYLRQWRPLETKASFFQREGISVNGKKIVVFAPDPLSNVDGKTKFGFDEVIVSRELSPIVRHTSERFLFIFKAHPNQDLSKLDKDFIDLVIVASPSIENNSLIYYSDIIVGFFSSYLLEAQVMDKKVLRYLPQGYKNDPFKDFSVGEIVNKDTFAQHLKQLT